MTGRVAVSSPHALSTRAGIDAFARGGNAIDAALATAASLTVTLPDNCSLGGDLIALVRDPHGVVTVVNASGPAAAAVPVDELREAHGDVTPVRGAHTVTVPGVVAGWDALWHHGARLPWADAFTHAIAQASDGVPVARSVARALALEPDVLGADPGIAALFYPDGEPLAEGAPLVQPALAETLSRLSRTGAREIYGDGETGERLLAALAGHGSALTAADLAGFTPEQTEPIATTHGDAEVLTAPPNSQGAMLLMILDAIGATDPLGSQAADVASAFDAAEDERARHLADPRGDTVAIVAADEDGRAVSLIQSLFYAFGAGILDPATGIIFHNRGSFFSLDPASPNVLAGGKRPAHTLTPVMVHEGGELAAVLGTMGGRAQPQILAHVLQRLRLGANASEAIDAPRWIVEDGAILAEQSVPEAATGALTAAGRRVAGLPDHDSVTGQSQLILRAPDGSYSAATDPRCEGAAVSGTRAQTSSRGLLQR